MKFYQLVGVGLLLIIAQAVVADRIALGRIAPDFIILVVVLSALHRGTIAGSLTGFLMGLVQDLSNPGFLGLNALTKSLLGYFAGQAREKTFPENAVFLGGLFFVCALGHDIVYLIFFHWPGIGATFSAIFAIALPSAVYTALVGVLLHRLFVIVKSRVVVSAGKEGQQ